LTKLSSQADKNNVDGTGTSIFGAAVDAWVATFDANPTGLRLGSSVVGGIAGDSAEDQFSGRTKFMVAEGIASGIDALLTVLASGGANSATASRIFARAAIPAVSAGVFYELAAAAIESGCVTECGGK
jgi:hypothetical protein